MHQTAPVLRLSNAWRVVGLALVAATLVVLAACGGGSSGGSASSPPPPALPTPPTGTSLPGPRPIVGPQAFVNYESGQVRPLALSADGQKLFAVNTPDNRLEIFAVGTSLVPLASVPVGLEPVALAEDPAGRVWVVNHLSDSISVVDVTIDPARVIQTLWVGDEPRDIVFAGAGRERAFVTTAHRGQNSPVDPAFNTPGIGRADVWVFDSTGLDDTPGGQALRILTLFGDRPRPLAVSSDGLRVYAGIFLSGNRTTVIGPGNIPKSPPTTSADNVEQPDTGVILKFTGGNWIDDQNRIWNNSVPFGLPDYDIFEIDAVTLSETKRHSGVGTILFNIAVNPISGVVYVSNMEARNHVRFSGTASRANTTVRGHLTEQRITVIDSDLVKPRILNKHIDFSIPSGSASMRALSVSTPLGMAVSGDGQTLYLSAFGSSVVGIYDTTELLEDTHAPSTSTQITVSGGGPSGIVLDENNGRAYVSTRFDNGLSTIDLAGRLEIQHLQMASPEPAAVVNGRRFLYDAKVSSGNGNDACASCHVFGDTDGLAWDLGEPDATISPIPNVFINISRAATPAQFHPMKGPMTTQSMRGLRGHGPMHWRGDRTGANRRGGETLEEAAFKEFNEAFDALMGLGRELDDDEMQAFTDFSIGIHYPPNPVRQFDNQPAGEQIRGEQLFRNGVVRIQTGVREVCAQCHPLNPAAGLFGTAGLSADNSQPGERNFKIPHFRDQYQKVGMFGWAFNSGPVTGPQIRGFAFNHNGATSSNFIIADLGMPQADLLALRAFLYSFPTESPAVTGQQITLSSNNLTDASSRLDLLVRRALILLPVPECDLIAKGVVAGTSRGWLMMQDGQFRPDSATASSITQAELLALLSDPADRITLTCVPWGSGTRIGIDRDLDGILDGDE